jgi:hypothetical protein
MILLNMQNLQMHISSGINSCLTVLRSGRLGSQQKNAKL